ncbi:hypothetical protein K353_02974 [Kitasatospora sp. SolWspMP-SS2h]|nr:hypothetical protein K353_02974 [Kitasatospora sp. SolWspMP-SS2h]
MGVRDETIQQSPIYARLVTLWHQSGRTVPGRRDHEWSRLVALPRFSAHPAPERERLSPHPPPDPAPAAPPPAPPVASPTAPRTAPPAASPTAPSVAPPVASPTTPSVVRPREAR